MTLKLPYLRIKISLRKKIAFLLNMNDLLKFEFAKYFLCFVDFSCTGYEEQFLKKFKWDISLLSRNGSFPCFEKQSFCFDNYKKRVILKTIVFEKDYFCKSFFFK